MSPDFALDPPGPPPPCNGTRDPRCECDRERHSYWDVGRGQCRPCDLCPRGWGAMRACGPRRNSACRRCPPGTYSGVLSATLACFPCGACPSPRGALRRCSRVQDTVCGDSGDPDDPDDPDALQYQPNLQTAYEVPSSDPNKYYAKGGLDHSVWPIYCALLGALVLALVLYVVLKRWRFNTPGPRRHLYARQSAATVKQNAASPFIVCAIKRKTLETLLNEQRPDGKDWRGLARELGYSPEKVRQLESRSRLKFDYNCTNRLLSDWSRRNGAAVGPFLVALHRLGNADAISALHGARCGARCCGGAKAPQTLICDTKTGQKKGGKFLRPPGGAHAGQPLGDMV